MNLRTCGRAAFAAILAVLPATLPAQRSANSAIAEKAWAAESAGRYLEAAEMLRPSVLKHAGNPLGDFLLNTWETIRSQMTGELDAAAFAAPKPPRPADLAAVDRAAAQDAIATIVARARQTRIVILNEDHLVPRSRAFALGVARALRPLGYDLLAAETFSNVADPVKARAAMLRLAVDGHVRRATGVYTRDPVFADLVRQALAIGYRPIAYEATDFRPVPEKDQVARREQAETDYLVRRVIAPYPHGKLLIYVGFSHGAETPLPGGGGGSETWMAARLKRATGIDPLTIEQTAITPTGSERALYATAAAKANGRAIVLTAAGTPLVFGEYRGAFDLQVVQPALPRVAGRPGWLVGMARNPTPIPARLLPASGTRLVQAFIATEGEDTVPVDQVLVTAGEPAPSLMLPQATIRYAVQDAPDGAVTPSRRSRRSR